MAQTGGCLCGLVRYQITGDVLATAVCHCRNCQKQSGSAFSVNTIVQADQVDISGDLATFADASDKGECVKRRFCGHCGSPILSELASSPGLLAIKSGTLDQLMPLQPQVQVWTKSRQPWPHLNDLPSFETDVPRS